MDKKELTELVLKSKEGDMDAMEKLLVYAHTSVSYQCRQMLKHEQDAEDMTQEVLVQVYQKLDTLQEPAAFHLWLKKITASRCINALTRTHKELQFAEDEEGHSVMDSLEEMDESKVPDKWLDNAETTRMIAEIVEGLPDAQRVSTLMFYYSEMSVKEISDSMGVSENTVKSRLNYARKAIKDKVKEYEKQGIKLYGLSPLPFLFFFLRQGAKDAEKPAAAKAMVKEILSEDALAALGAFGASSSASAAAAGSAAAGTAAAGTAAGAAAAGATASATATAVATGGLAALISAIPVKVVVGIAAAVIAVGSITTVAVTAENKKEERSAATSAVSEAPAQGDDQLCYPEEDTEDAAFAEDPSDGAEETEATDPETEETEPEETEAEDPETEEDAPTEPAAGENGAGAPETDEGGVTEPDDETEPTEPEDDGTEPTEPEDDGTDPTEPETEEDETETEGCAHSYELVESREADCCFSGFDLYVCTSCGENLHENVVPPTGEHEGYYEEVVGCITYTRCVSTGERFKITGEHNYIDIGYMPPNCVAPGGYWVECTVCGERMVALEGYEEPLGHEYQTTVIPPTCMSEGYTLVECVNCHDSWAENIVPSTDHGSEVVEVVPPTQTSEGYTVYQCPGCGHTWYDDFTAPLS